MNCHGVKEGPQPTKHPCLRSTTAFYSPKHRKTSLTLIIILSLEAFMKKFILEDFVKASVMLLFSLHECGMLDGGGAEYHRASELVLIFFDKAAMCESTFAPVLECGLVIELL
jgi:hypothetical protein